MLYDEYIYVLRFAIVELPREAPNWSHEIDFTKFWWNSY